MTHDIKSPFVVETKYHIWLTASKDSYEAKSIAPATGTSFLLLSSNVSVICCKACSFCE
jgi:hypothetical protein